MNKRALILVILFAAVSLSACANNPASTAYGTGAEVEASTATTAENGDTKEMEEMTGSTPSASSFEPVTEVPSESAEAESTASPNTAAPESSEKPATEASKPTEKTEQPQQTETPVSTPSEPASEPEEPPQSTEEPSKPTPEPEPTTPAFDVSGYVSFAKNYAQSIGLSLDSTATGCWDTPIEAHAGCIYLERDIRDRLDWYLDSGFTAIWVWSVDLGGGNHEIFIGYA